MQNNQNPKVVFITGSSGGIGETIADLFLSNGHEVIFHGIDGSVFAVSEKYAVKYSKNILAVTADLSSRKEMDDMSEKIIQSFKRVDILINNAGMQYVCPVESFPLEKWDKILAVNLTAPFYLTQKFWTKMKEQNFGRIVNISSVHGLRASEYKTAYVSSKHGLNGLTKALALEGAPFNITVNSICPGYVKTPIVEGQIEDQIKAHGINRERVINEVILGKHAVKKFVDPLSIAKMCLFLSDESSGHVTGSEIVMDAGWSAK